MITKIYAPGGIPDVWFMALYHLVQNNRRYRVDLGSFECQDRIEIPDFVVLEVHNAYQEPWDLMRPIIPKGLGIPDPVGEGYIEEYIQKVVLGNTKAPNEDYTYGQRIDNQIEQCSQKLKASPGTNHAVIQIAAPGDLSLHDPPCLRHVDMKVMDGELIMYPYFRSWELWAGLPANLAAIAIIQEMLCNEIGVERGPIIASTKSLHIYDYAMPLALLRCAGASKVKGDKDE